MQVVSQRLASVSARQIGSAVCSEDHAVQVAHAGSCLHDDIPKLLASNWCSRNYHNETTCSASPAHDDIDLLHSRTNFDVATLLVALLLI